MKSQSKQKVPEKIGRNSRKNLLWNRNTRLWLMLLFAVVLYGVIWIFTSSRIVLVQSQLPSRNRDTQPALSQPLGKNLNHEIHQNFVNGNKAFLSYRLEYDRPYNVTYGPHTKCTVGLWANKWGRKKMRRVKLAKPLSKILDVSAYLRTNLKIITVGDSVAMQFHELLEEALQPPTVVGPGGSDTYRTVYQNAWGTHESVSVSAPVHGGGALAAFRMTGLLLPEGKDNPPPNNGPNLQDSSGGWIPEHVRQILDHNYTTPVSRTGGAERKSTASVQTLGSFDVMIFRIPHGWLPASSITRGRLEKSLLLARELFGARTVIIQTLFLNNNVKTMEDLNDMRKVNLMIKELVEDSWGAPNLPDLLLMDFGGWTDQLTELNARLAGMDTKSNANYTLERLGCARFPPSIAMACAKKTDPGSCQCTRNMMSIDGMHWCMETLGGRIIAEYSCLLQCSLLINNTNVMTDNTSDRKRTVLGTCQRRCNDQFMSLREASSLVANITTFSVS